MKNWSLRTRLTVWSALFFALAVALLGVFTISLVRRHQIENLDADLMAEARTFYHELYEHGPAGAFHALTELDKSTRVVAIGPDGKALHVSPQLGAERFADAAPGAQTLRGLRVVGVSENDFIVRLARDFSDVEATVSDVRRAYLLSLPVLMSFVAAGAFFLVRSALNPVRKISATARRITAEHLEERLPQPERRDEIGQLTEVLNGMLERLDRSFQQAMRFTADASHELRTPLSLISTGLEELLRRRDLPPDVVASLGAVLEDSRRLAAVCQDLLVLARADAGHLLLDRKPHDLTALIEAAVEDAQILGEPRGITVRAELPPHGREAIDGRYFTQIVLNLLANAVKFNCDGGWVRVQLELHGGAWRLDVENSGVPIPTELQTKLFGRFFRAENSAAAPGHGLGLSLSRELARAHGGDLVLVRSDAESTLFRLTIPCVQSMQAAQLVD